jgi:hypothetical protein
VRQGLTTQSRLNLSCGAGSRLPGSGLLLRNISSRCAKRRTIITRQARMLCHHPSFYYYPSCIQNLRSGSRPPDRLQGPWLRKGRHLPQSASGLRGSSPATLAKGASRGATSSLLAAVIDVEYSARNALSSAGAAPTPLSCRYQLDRAATPPRVKPSTQSGRTCSPPVSIRPHSLRTSRSDRMPVNPGAMTSAIVSVVWSHSWRCSSIDRVRARQYMTLRGTHPEPRPRPAIAHLGQPPNLTEGAAMSSAIEYRYRTPACPIRSPRCYALVQDAALSILSLMA